MRTDSFQLWRATAENVTDTIPVDDRFPVIRAWEFGVRPYVLHSQIVWHDEPVRWCQIRCIAETSFPQRIPLTRTVALEVQRHSAEKYRDCKFFGIADISANAGGLSGRSHVKEIRDATGITIMTRKTVRFDGIETVGLKILERVDGRPGLIVSQKDAPVLADILLHKRLLLDERGGLQDNSMTKDWIDVAESLRLTAAWFLNLRDIVGIGRRTEARGVVVDE